MAIVAILVYFMAKLHCFWSFGVFFRFGMIWQPWSL
jgi:hypothetical protein